MFITGQKYSALRLRKAGIHGDHRGHEPRKATMPGQLSKQAHLGLDITREEEPL
jgi:hypothetical protein